MAAILSAIHVCVSDNVRDRVCVRDHGWNRDCNSGRDRHFIRFDNVRGYGTDHDRNCSFYIVILALVVNSYLFVFSLQFICKPFAGFD